MYYNRDKELAQEFSTDFKKWFNSNSKVTENLSKICGPNELDGD